VVYSEQSPRFFLTILQLHVLILSILFVLEKWFDISKPKTFPGITHTTSFQAL
jgi:hypothetical protein